MTTLVIIGGSASQLPYIQASQRLGYETHVIDMDPTCEAAIRMDPDARGDVITFHEASARDPERVLEICEAVRPDGVFTYSSHPMCLRGAWLACEVLGLRGFDVNALMYTEDRVDTRDRLYEAGVRYPGPFGLGHAAVFKPSAGTRDGQGVSVDPPDEMRASLISRAMSSHLLYMAEERIVGREVTVGGYVYDDEPRVLVVADKTPGQPPVACEPPLHVETIAKRAARALGITHSFFSVDMIIDDDGPCVIDVGLLMDAGVDKLVTCVDVYELRCQMAVGAL